MAIYDAQSKKVVVRVVYDGPGMAGKTTNLEQLCTFFTRQRRSELYSGARAGERTLCLDWLQLDGGLVRGHELRCHLLTVPGQAVLSRRRQMLLSLADATVFVLDSTEKGLSDAKAMWLSMLAHTGGPDAGVPVVLQANKQDQPGALSPAQIREHWQLDPAIPIVAAQASTGQGVRETVVLAIRATAVRLQEELLGNGIGALQGHYESGEELERRMVEAEQQNPMSAVDVVLAAHGLATAGMAAPPAGEEPARATPAASNALPCLPSGDIPNGLVWPATEGRKTLKRVPVRDAVLRSDLVRGAGPDTARADSDSMIFEAGIWRLETSGQRRYPDADRARNHLVRLAHVKLDLGVFCAPRTVLAVQKDEEGWFWLWTVSLWLAPLRSQMSYAVETGDERALGLVLQQFAEATLRGWRLCLDAGLVLDLTPDNLGNLCGEAFYLRDEVSKGSCVPGAGRAILGCFDEYAQYGGALQTFSEALLAGMAKRFRPGDLELLDVARSIESAPVATAAGERGKQRLLSGLRAEHGGAL